MFNQYLRKLGFHSLEIRVILKHREGTEIVNSEYTAAQQKIPRQQTDVSVTEEIRKMSIISTAL